MTGRCKGMKSILTKYENLSSQNKITAIFFNHHRKYLVLAQSVHLLDVVNMQAKSDRIQWITFRLV